MTLILAIIFILCIFVALLPFFIGFIILFIGNSIVTKINEKPISVFWIVATTIVSIFSAILFYQDVFNENIDRGPLPFIILLVYAVFSIACIAVISSSKRFGKTVPYKNVCEKSLQIPKEITEIVSEEYHNFFDGEVPQEFVQKVYNEYLEWEGDIKNGITKNLYTGVKTYDWKAKETWEDYPTPKYDEMHTYCSVIFDDSGKSFYYRTRNPNLKVGDFVYVPVGYKYTKRMAKIVAIKKYLGKQAPYPLEKTRHIIDKVDK